jgi:hypothetical protein
MSSLVAILRNCLGGNAEEGEGILIAHGGEQEMEGIDGD